MPSSCLLLRGTHILRVFGGGVYLVVYVFFICVLLFYAERVPRGYLGFGVNLVINLLSTAHLRTFLFYLEPASPGYLDCGVYVIINLFFFLLRFTCFPLVLFFTELISPRYSSLLSYLLAFSRSSAYSTSTWNSHPPAIWVLDFF